jgi:8-oxo-dGTP pyrophosphatase MutT (NUDIX family)
MGDTKTEPGPGGTRHRPDRRVHFHDPAAPAATVVVPSVFVSVRDEQCRVLLVRRRDSGSWELPGGRVDVGESAVGTAVREVAEETGLQVRITGLVGLFTDPAYVVEAADGGEIRQQFVVCMHAWVVGGSPAPDMTETVEVAWFDPAEALALQTEQGARLLIEHALSGAIEPHLT